MYDQVKDIVGSTREMLMPHFGNAVPEKKPGEDTAYAVVTELDRLIERYLESELKKLEPQIPLVGEEYGGSRDHERYWLCDPIDGTAHFIRGMPFCSVMLALVERNQVTLSFIYDFVNDQMFHAQRGSGAFANTKPLRVSDRPLSDSYLSFETRTEKPENANLRERVRKVSILFSAITAGYEFALVASGKLEGRICMDPYGKDFDFLPGLLLVEEAGGTVANLGSRSLDIRNLDFIAANPRVYQELTEGPGAIFPKRD